MQNLNPKLRLTLPQIYVLMGWFIFQEKNDIRSEKTSMNQIEIDFSNILDAAATKMKKAAKGCYICITPDEAKIAHDWFKNSPEIFVDKKDRKMYDCLNVFVHEDR